MAGKVENLKKRARDGNKIKQFSSAVYAAFSFSDCLLWEKVLFVKLFLKLNMLDFREKNVFETYLSFHL